MHGIPMTEEAFERMISVESEYRYELIDGIVYDMTGSTPEHSAIASNVESLLREQLGRGGPCRVHHDQYVVIPGKPPVVPDVVLTCDRADWDKDKRLRPFMIRSPLIVVEVLSPSSLSERRQTAVFSPTLGHLVAEMGLKINALPQIFVLSDKLLVLNVTIGQRNLRVIHAVPH